MAKKNTKNNTTKKYQWHILIRGIAFTGWGDTLEEAKADALVQSLKGHWGC